MAKSFSNLTQNWSAERKEQVKREADRLAAEQAARQSKLFVDFDAGTEELIKTVLLGSQKILVELDAVRNENAQLMQRIARLEMLLSQRTLQPA